MAGKPGRAGPKSDKLWSDAVRLAALREARDDDGQTTRRINIIADNLVKAAIAGDIMAIKEVGDRIDGKARQQIDGPGDGGEHLITVIERRIVNASS